MFVFLIAILFGFCNNTFAQEEIDYNFECLPTPYQADIYYHDDRMICENGVLTYDTLDDPCKDFYHQNGIEIMTLPYKNAVGETPFGEMLIEEVSHQGIDSKIIELKEGVVLLSIPEGIEIESVSFDLYDESKEGINFSFNNWNWFSEFYEDVDALMEAPENSNMIRIGDRIHILEEVSSFHIGGDHVKISNIRFNEDVDLPTSVNHLNETEISIFPNPVQDVLNVEFEEEIFSLQITDAQGKIIVQKQDLNFFQQINTSDWAKGIYFLSASTNTQKRITQKIVKH